MADKYFVMRGLRRSSGSNRRFRGFTEGDLESAGPQPSMETVEEERAATLHADPNNDIVIQNDLLLSLIAPQANEGDANAPWREVGSQRMPGGLVAVGAHTSPCTGQGVTVAVLDTGLDTAHPAFAGLDVVTRDFTGEGKTEADVTDLNGHGTHCAATVCARPVEGVRVGVAPGVTKLCVGKVLGKNGGAAGALLNALFWAVFEQKATVVSLSLGYDLPGNTKKLIEENGVDPALAAQSALRQQADLLRSVATLKAFLEGEAKNVIFVAASGNESKRPKFVLDASLPASELLAVGAVGPSGDGWAVAPFSNGRVQLVAPGVGVLSAAVGGGWKALSGTSMATPHAAGIAALWTEQLRNQGTLSVPGAVISAMRGAASRNNLTNDVAAVGQGLVQAPQ